MKSFQDWIVERHPEFMNEGRLSKALGGIALGAASLMGTAQAAPRPEPAAAVQQQNNVEVKEENGKLYIKAFITLQDNTPQEKLSAKRVAENKIARAAAKHFNPSGSGFVPPYKIQGVDDFLGNKTDFIWASWDLK